MTALIAISVSSNVAELCIVTSILQPDRCFSCVVTLSDVLNDGIWPRRPFRAVKNSDFQTYCTNKQVADSACTATAIASGVKTKARVIGLDDSVRLANCTSVTDGAKLGNILKWSQDVDKSTGIVTTTRITHATPAAFFAHSADRDWEDDSAIPEGHRGCKDIAKQLVEDAPGKDLRVPTWLWFGACEMFYVRFLNEYHII